MSSKSKKNLAFLTTEKINKPKQRIIMEKQAYAQDSKNISVFLINIIWIITLRKNLFSLLE